MRHDIPTDTKDVPYRYPIILAALVAVAFTVVFLPLVQAILYRLLIATPGFVQWAVVAAIIGAAGIVTQRQGLVVAAGIVFVVMGLLIGPIAGGVYAHSHVANEMQRDATELETLPNTSKENVRVLPRSVSDKYAQSSMQYPQYRLTQSDITHRNDSYAWSHALAPDNVMVSLFGNQHGALYVNMTTTEKRVHVEETTFQNGRGQLLFDSFQYQSVLKEPLVDHEWNTAFNARVGGTSYIAHSTVSHQWRFRLAPIPQLYAVPTHGSVEVMYPNGSIDVLSPQEARQSRLLRGQNYYPYELATFRVRSMQYVHGALNKWFWKEDVLAIADLPEKGNTWPLVVPTEGRGPELTYFIATEPTGSGNGVYEIWTMDGQTGKAGVQRYSDSQIGPQKAVDYVERRPQVNRLSNAVAIAPIPIVKGDTLYWHVKVVPKSRTGVIYTGFVNAESGDTTLIEGTNPIYAFLTKGEVKDIQNRTKGQAGGMTVTVVVTNANGEIVGTRNITAPKGGGIQVDVQSRAANNSTAQAGGSE